MYQTPPKLGKKKIIELCLLIFLVLWGLLFLINYIRYTESKPLIFAIHNKSEYEDGVVDEYIGLGYIYRSYRRTSISREEFVPFWILKETPESEALLPQILTDYDVPDNIRHSDKYRGLLYYYVKGELFGTYKCINSSGGCEKATGGYDKYNIINVDPITRLEKQRTLTSIYDKYAFVDDSSEQDTSYGDSNYIRTIYLINFLDEEKEIIAEYADVKESTYIENKDLADGENYRYIVKSVENNKWGLINITEKGNIKEVLPFEYESINYDSDTGYYILCKDDIWYVYDLENDKKVSTDSTEPIYDVWRNDNLTYYFKTGHERIVGDDKFIDYKIYRIDGTIFLNVDKVTLIVSRGNCVFYLTATDSVLHFIDYSKEEKYKLQLAFSNMESDDFNHPAFEIAREYNGIITLKVYQGRELKYDYENVSINTVRWENNEER